MERTLPEVTERVFQALLSTRAAYLQDQASIVDLIYAAGRYEEELIQARHREDLK